MLDAFWSCPAGNKRRVWMLKQEKQGAQGWGESLKLVSELPSRAGADKYKHGLFPSKLVFGVSGGGFCIILFVQRENMKWSV